MSLQKLDRRYIFRCIIFTIAGHHLDGCLAAGCLPSLDAVHGVHGAPWQGLRGRASPPLHSRKGWAPLPSSRQYACLPQLHCKECGKQAYFQPFNADAPFAQNIGSFMKQICFGYIFGECLTGQLWGVYYIIWYFFFGKKSFGKIDCRLVVIEKPCCAAEFSTKKIEKRKSGGLSWAADSNWFRRSD